MCSKCRVLKYEFTVMGVHTDHQMTTEGLNRYPVSDYIKPKPLQKNNKILQKGDNLNNVYTDLSLYCVMLY